jgi:hypothetical protein
MSFRYEFNGTVYGFRHNNKGPDYSKPPPSMMIFFSKKTYSSESKKAPNKFGAFNINLLFKLIIH